MGDHAGEGANAIFRRKKKDIEHTGKTFWLIHSTKAKPVQVQAMCQGALAYAIFVEPATLGGARPTSESDAAREFSHDKGKWHCLPKSLTPVTGKLDAAATALVFDKISTDVSGNLDLWEYGEFPAQRPIRFILGCSTTCALRMDTKSHPDRMKSRERRIVAVARLAAPYCVWVRR